MRFAPPGGELTGWSILWLLSAVLSIYLAATTGYSALYVLAAAVGLPTLGMWFGLRWCGYLFALLMVVTIPLAVLALFMLDATWMARGVRLVKILSAAYFAKLTFDWAREE